MRIIDFDVLIYGGGVVGLWSLAILRQAGYSAMLVENNRLGGVQTLASQGIIHSGVKYALTGQLTPAATSIAAMPKIWRACLSGVGKLNLSNVKVLTEHQCLWTTDSLGSTVAGFFASHAMRSRVVAIRDSAQLPYVFQHSQFNGKVYRLNEPVLDVKSLIVELMRLGEHNYFSFAQTTNFTSSTEFRLRPRRIVLAAGAGNEQLIKNFGLSDLAMQRRPLHMVMVRGNLPPLYAHCLGVSAVPRVTITSHPLENGEQLWYLGGQLAETGVDKSPLQQIRAAQQELVLLLPWLDFQHLHWSTLKVERAEPLKTGLMRPDRYFFTTHDDVSIVWPTKLAFAPAIAMELLADLETNNIKPCGEIVDLPALPKPLEPKLPWEIAEFVSI